MVDPKTFQSDIQKLLYLINKQFGFRAKDLRRAMHRVGRRLPKSAHQQAAVLLDAAEKSRHPKLAMQLDDQVVKNAFDALSEAIRGYDRKKARNDQLWDILGTIVFNLVFLAALIFGLLYMARDL